MDRWPWSTPSITRGGTKSGSGCPRASCTSLAADISRHAQSPGQIRNFRLSFSSRYDHSIEKNSVEFNSFLKSTKVEILNSLLRKKNKTIIIILTKKIIFLSARGLSTEQRNRQQEVWRGLFPVSRHSKFHRTIRVWPTSVTRVECLEVTPGQAGKSKQTDWRYISVTGGIFLRARVEMRYFFLIIFLFILIFHAI